MPDFPAFRLNPYYTALRTWLTTALNDDGTIRDSAVQAAGASVFADKTATEAALLRIDPGVAGNAHQMMRIVNGVPAWINPVEIDVADFGALGNGVADDTTAIQDAIDYAQTLFTASGTGGLPVIRFRGDHRITDSLVRKSAPWIGTNLINGTSIRWNGAAGGTMVVQDDTPGSFAFSSIQEIGFRSGTNEPAHFLDFTDGGSGTVFVDAQFLLFHVHFFGCTDSPIVMERYVNVHWDHVRWDNVGGYAVEVKPGALDFRGSFCIDGFSYDHSRTTSPGLGFMLIDLTNHPVDIGPVVIKNARLEVNQPWAAGPRSLVTLYHGADSTASGRSAPLHLEDLTLADNASMGNGCVIYRDTANTTQEEAYRLDNVLGVFGGTTLAGTWASTQPGETGSPSPASPHQWDGYYANALGGIALKVKSGASGDSDFVPGGTAPEGITQLDRGNHRFFAKLNGNYRYMQITGGTSPSVNVQSGAGSGASGSVSGNDGGGRVTLTTGTGVTTSSDLIWVLYSQTYTAGVKSVILTPANAAAAALNGNQQVHVSANNNNRFTIGGGSTALADSTEYQWFYQMVL